MTHDPHLMAHWQSGKRLGRGGGAAIPQRHAELPPWLLASRTLTDWQGRSGDQGEPALASSSDSRF